MSEDLKPLAPQAQKIAAAVIARASSEERALLATWADEMLTIRDSRSFAPSKVWQICTTTHKLGLTTALLQHIWSEIRRVGWDERSGVMRGALGGTLIGLVASFSGPMAGLALFGTAVAMPVVLLGAGGGALLIAIIEEARGAKKK